MTATPQFTICITMGLRPDLLQRSIESMGPELRKLPIIGINDFGDEPTSEMFRRLCPHGTLVDLGEQVGHHPAADAMYKLVKTPYVFHMEDDWEFTNTEFLDDCVRLLDANKQLSMVCLRKLEDFPHTDKERALVKSETYEDLSYYRLDGLHKQWHGYTFNPHIARLSLWEQLGGFSQFEKERHISRHLRRQGLYCAFLKPGTCHHIGDGFSVAHAPPTRFKRFKNWLRGR